MWSRTWDRWQSTRLVGQHVAQTARETERERAGERARERCVRVHVCSRACVHVCAFVFTCVSQLDLLLVLEHTCFRLITCCANPWDAAHQCDGAIFDAQLARHDLGTEAEADTDTATELKSKARADTHTHTHTHTQTCLILGRCVVACTGIAGPRRGVWSRLCLPVLLRHLRRSTTAREHDL